MAQYVKAWCDWIEQTSALEDDEKGRLFIAILEYAKSGAIIELPGRENLLLPVFRAQVDRDFEVRDKLAQNGTKGGRVPKSKSKQTKAKTEIESKIKQEEANASKVKQTEANESKIKHNKDKEEDKDKDKEKEKDKDEEEDSVVCAERTPPPRTTRFIPPTLAEVRSYVAERHSPVDPQEFLDFYASKGWMVGKTPMKDWKAACRNAERWDRWARHTRNEVTDGRLQTDPRPDLPDRVPSVSDDWFDD